MRLSARRMKPVLVGALYISALLAALLMSSHQASAFGFVFIESSPAVKSSDAVATFEFASMGGTSFECKIDGAAYAACTSPFVTPAMVDGAHTFNVHMVGQVGPNTTATYTWTVNVLPVFTGGSNVSGAADTPAAITDLQIEDSGNDNLTVQLTVSSGSLSMSTTTGLSFTGSPTGTSLKFSGTRTNLNTALATLSYTPSSSGAKVINAVIAGVNDEQLDIINGHVFKAVFAPSGINWHDAKTAAEASTYGGAAGYLATIADSDELDFVGDRLLGTSWIGASDESIEGDWKWLSGPANGTSFWSGGVNGSAVASAFTAWRGSMPDNYGGNENCMEMEMGTPATWNDQVCSRLNIYYVAEYGDGITIPYVDFKQITVTDDTDNDGLTNTIESAAPNSGDANNDGTADSVQANVSSQPGILSNKYVVVQTGCASNLNFQIGAESSSQQDVAFDYPLGLMGFIGINCGSPGVSVPVTQYYFGDTDPAKLVLRKWNTTKGIYTSIDGVILSKVTIGGQVALKVVYAVVDGGPLDQDGTADGNIKDPVGLGLSVLGAPNTGLGRQQPSPTQLLMVSLLANIKN